MRRIADARMHAQRFNVKAFPPPPLVRIEPSVRSNDGASDIG